LLPPSTLKAHEPPDAIAKRRPLPLSAGFSTGGSGFLTSSGFFTSRGFGGQG